MLADGDEPETLPGTRECYYIHEPSRPLDMCTVTLDIADYAQSTGNHDTAPGPMHTSATEGANELNVTSPTIEGVEHANEASQDSVGVIRDEIYDRKAVSDGAGKCDAISRCRIDTIICPAATDTEDREDENGSTTPRNLSLASSSARSDDDGDGDAFVSAGAWASTAPAVPEGSPTNRLSKCL